MLLDVSSYLNNNNLPTLQPYSQMLNTDDDDV
jgi:hypothetical protein